MNRSFPSFYLCRLMAFFLFLVPVCLSGQNASQHIQSQKADSVRNSIHLPVLNPLNGSIEDFIQNNQELPSEKIFLHADRTNYALGDTIWFKAYLWYGFDQVPDTISGILYVDLIDAEGRVALKRRLLIKNGTSNGEFSLDTTIASGLYSLRAYTRLMRDINTYEPFYQTVKISPVKQKFQFECTPVILKQIRNDSLKIVFRFFETDAAGNLNKNLNHRISYSFKIGDQLIKKDSILAENTKENVLRYSLEGINKHDSVAAISFSIGDNLLSFEKQFTIPLLENIDLQFFPEGGNLVAGLESKVAFKAIGIDGLGREVKGEILADDEKVISSFISTSKGMGYFILKPQTKIKYAASFWFNNQKYIVPLPLASEEGTVISLNFSENSRDPILSIKQTPSESITKKYITGSAYGKIWFSAIVKAFKDSCGLKIPLELLPEGVCRLTLVNENFKPECERLIYVDKNQNFKIEVIPDSVTYRSRSKVTLLIKTAELHNTPVQTSLSLAVLDKEQVLKSPNAHGIRAFKLLESELHGYIEDADAYFKNDSSANKGNLELLLLTQGYRKFLPKNTAMDELIFQPEKNLQISGIIKLDGTESQVRKFNYRNIGITLMSVSKEPYVGLSNPDSLGNFRFKLPLIIGKPHLMVQATTVKKKPFNCKITIANPVPPPKFNTRPPVSDNIPSPVFEFTKHIETVNKSDPAKFKLPGTMSKSLGGVIITAKVTPKNWWRNYDKDATKIADLDILDPEGDKYMNINDLLVKEFGAIYYNNVTKNMNTVLLPCFRTIGQGLLYWFPIYLVDGKIYWNGKDFDFSALNTLSAFPVNEIKKISVIPYGKSIVTHYAYEPIIGFPQFILQSMVIIETYSKNTYRGELPGVKKFILDGLDAPRAFYSPRYEGPSKNRPEYDVRATLFWDPSIRTDSNGQATVEFYTSDRKTDFEVIINGIELKTGFPGEGKAQIHSNVK